MPRRPRPEPVPGRPPRWWRRTRRSRQLVAAVLVALVVAGLATAVRPAATGTAPVVVASVDLEPGAALTDADVALAERPTDAVPVDAVGDVDAVRGRLLASPVRAGEVVRERDVVAGALLSALGPGLVAVPVRLADEGAAALLRAGDVVDLVSAHDGAAEVVATGVRVLAVPRTAAPASVLGSGSSSEGGSLVVVAASTSAGLAVQRAEAEGRVGVLVRASP